MREGNNDEIHVTNGKNTTSDSPFSIDMFVSCMVATGKRCTHRGKGYFYVLCSCFLL